MSDSVSIPVQFVITVFHENQERIVVLVGEFDAKSGSFMLATPRQTI